MYEHHDSVVIPESLPEICESDRCCRSRSSRLERINDRTRTYNTDHPSPHLARTTVVVPREPDRLSLSSYTPDDRKWCRCTPSCTPRPSYISANPTVSIKSICQALGHMHYLRGCTSRHHCRERSHWCHSPLASGEAFRRQHAACRPNLQSGLMDGGLT